MILLNAVQNGETLVITRYGRPIAKLVPSGDQEQLGPAEAVEAIKEFRKGRQLDGLSIRGMIEEGRR